MDHGISHRGRSMLLFLHGGSIVFIGSWCRNFGFIGNAQKMARGSVWTPVLFAVYRDWNFFFGFKIEVLVGKIV